jgi:adenine phosphoribosyltransferase
MAMKMADKRIDKIKNAIRDIPDYPQKGIIFKDITTLLRDADIFRSSIDLLIESVSSLKIDVVAAIESRGFIFGSVIANKIGVGFIPIRKPGKLPADVYVEEYDLEYGTDKIEMHRDALKTGDKVLLVDDLLATGGTAKAACNLVEKGGGSILTILFLIELNFLNGRQLLEGYPVRSIINYD